MPLAEPGTARRTQAPQGRTEVAALTHSAEDRAIVEAQLGRPTRGRWGVARRCHLGVPMVIENHPVLDDGTPFPTLYWLTCPILNKRIGAIEGAGVMSALSDRLGEDGDLKARLRDAIERYRDARAAHAELDDRGAPPGGGPDRVKCLHAHVAHELAGGNNPAGALALSMVGWPDCVAPCAEVGG